MKGKLNWAHPRSVLNFGRGRDGALRKWRCHRRHRPRRAGGTCAVQRSTTQIAPLDAALKSSRGVGIPTKNNARMRQLNCDLEGSLDYAQFTKACPVA